MQMKRRAASKDKANAFKSSKRVAGRKRAARNDKRPTVWTCKSYANGIGAGFVFIRLPALRNPRKVHLSPPGGPSEHDLPSNRPFQQSKQLALSTSGRPTLSMCSYPKPNHRLNVSQALSQLPSSLEPA